MDWIESDSEHVWHPFTQVQTESKPIAVERAEGVWVYGVDGSKYLDANSSWWVNIHGHGHPALVQSIKDQADKLQHVIFAGITHQPAADLAVGLLKWLPSYSKVFYSDNGSTAVEVAIKMAFQYWDNKDDARNTVIAIGGAYHGDTFGSMSVSERDVFNKPFEPFLFDVKYIDRPTESNLESVLDSLDTILSSNKVAAFIYEPLVQGAAGMKMYSVDHLERLMQLCRKHDVLLIADEIMTGFGRTGTMFASDKVLIKPDLICLSKGLTGGYLPLGATITTDKLFDAFLSDEKRKGFLHGHSFTGNPMACAVAKASLDLFDSAYIWQQMESIEKQHQIFLEKFRTQFNHDIRVCGTILAIDFKINDQDGYFNPAFGKVYNFFIKKGLIVRPLGNTVFVNPPYCISSEELKMIYDALLELAEWLNHH